MKRIAVVATLVSIVLASGCSTGMPAEGPTDVLPPDLSAEVPAILGPEASAVRYPHDGREIFGVYRKREAAEALGLRDVSTVVWATNLRTPYESITSSVYFFEDPAGAERWLKREAPGSRRATVPREEIGPYEEPGFHVRGGSAAGRCRSADSCWREFMVRRGNVVWRLTAVRISRDQFVHLVDLWSVE